MKKLRNLPVESREEKIDKLTQKMIDELNHHQIERFGSEEPDRINIDTILKVVATGIYQAIGEISSENPKN